MKLKRIAAGVTLAATLLVSAPIGAQASDQPGQLESGQLEHSDVERRTPAQQRASANIELPSFTDVPCLQFTDSIVRLYTAYFLRAPELGGFDFWHDEYVAGRWSLPQMSTFFSESPEFVSLYGSLTDAEFIDLIYQNIFGRPADAGGRDFWLGRMQNEGLSRGTVMLNFSESPEYITQTATAPSPAGHFNWYPQGTQFSCGFGDMQYDILQFPSYMDVIVFNFRDVPIDVRYEVLQAGQWTTVQDTTLNPTGFLQGFGWAMIDGSITAIRLTGTGSFNWSIAHSPTVTPTTRVGWTPA